MRRSLAAVPAVAAGTAGAAGAAGAAGTAGAAGVAGTAGAPGAAAASGASSEPVTLRTEFSFDLPRGYVDEAGVLHRSGAMRLATARDELVPLRDDRVRENPAYLTVVLLGRVVTRIGTITDVHAGIIENLFASDVAFLQDLYRRVNSEGHTRAGVTCPECRHRFDVELAGGRLGE